MEKQKLKIIVAGEVGSGKSRLTFLLKNFLREQGFDVEYVPNSDHLTESIFDLRMVNHFDGVIDIIKQTRKITLEEEQLKRNSK